MGLESQYMSLEVAQNNNLMEKQRLDVGSYRKGNSLSPQIPQENRLKTTGCTVSLPPKAKVLKSDSYKYKQRDTWMANTQLNYDFIYADS